VSLLSDADCYREDNDRSTESTTRLRGECEFGLGSDANYFFPRMINEGTMDPRPASPVSTTNVETCHPL
jgi:hypothetical protein